MVYTDTWNAAFEGEPEDTDNVADGAGDIRDFKLAIRERIAHDHYFDVAGTDADQGEHATITMRVQAAPGSPGANKAYLYGLDVSSKIELHYKDEDDNIIQLTNAGRLNEGLFIDEDDMTSDSDEYAPTQQSVKAYALNQAIGTTKGDVIGFTASDTPTRLAVGTDGQIIVADSGEAAGIKWDDVLTHAAPVWTYGSQVSIATGSSYELISTIPATAKEVQVIINNVQCDTGAANYYLRLGDSGGLETTGYVSVCENFESTGGTVGGAALTTGLLFAADDGIDAGDNLYGVINLCRWDVSEYVWIATGLICTNDDVVASSAGRKTLTAELTTINLLQASGGTFNGGEARVRYR